MSIVNQTLGQLEYLTAEGIVAPHCFTTRLGGVSQGYLDSLNIGFHRGDTAENVEQNFAILGHALDFDLKNTVLTHQVHTDVVRVVTKADAAGLDNHAYPECDGLVTNDPGTALVVFTADCTPILLWDPVTGAVGAAHAGWRGTAMDIAGKTVQKMAEAFGCKPENIHAAIGPNLGQCCFQTDADVPQGMLTQYGEAAKEFIRSDGAKFYVNLKSINALALHRSGVKHIEISGDCTMCHHDRYWSHRFTRGIRGSQGAIIVCKEAQP